MTKSGERYPLGMRNWIPLCLALLGCSEDPDVVVYVVTSEGGSSSIGGASEAQEAALSVGGKTSVSSSSTVAGSGGSPQSSSSQGGSSAVERSSIGGSSAQTSQTSRALTVSFGGMPQIVTSAPISMGGSLQVSTTSMPNVPPQDCTVTASNGKTYSCGEYSLGSMVCNADGECVALDGFDGFVMIGSKLDCDFNGVPETVVGDANCGSCGRDCGKYMACVVRDGRTPLGDPYTEWACDVSIK